MHKEDIKLSRRLEMSVNMVNGPVNAIADIGCDHAHTDIFLVKNGTAGRCIGMDVRPGPLQKASENLAMYDCADKVELRLSNGFDALKRDEAEVAIIAGMGGILMRNILEKGLGKEGHLYGSRIGLILQPQSHIEEIRRWLYENGYIITDEDMCLEDGKYYFSMKAEQTPDGGIVGISEAEMFFGPVLLRKRPEILCRYLNDMLIKARRRLSQIGKSGSKAAGEKKLYFEKIVNMIGEFTWITLR